MFCYGPDRTEIRGIIRILIIKESSISKLLTYGSAIESAFLHVLKENKSPKKEKQLGIENWPNRTIWI